MSKSVEIKLLEKQVELLNEQALALQEKLDDREVERDMEIINFVNWVADNYDPVGSAWKNRRDRSEVLQTDELLEKFRNPNPDDDLPF